jgi:hypothetical protein
MSNGKKVNASVVAQLQPLSTPLPPSPQLIIKPIGKTKAKTRNYHGRSFTRSNKRFLIRARKNTPLPVNEPIRERVRKLKTSLKPKQQYPLSPRSKSPISPSASASLSSSESLPSSLFSSSDSQVLPPQTPPPSPAYIDVPLPDSTSSESQVLLPRVRTPTPPQARVPTVASTGEPKTKIEKKGSSVSNNNLRLAAAVSKMSIKKSAAAAESAHHPRLSMAFLSHGELNENYFIVPENYKVTFFAPTGKELRFSELVKNYYNEDESFEHLRESGTAVNDITMSFNPFFLEEKWQKEKYLKYVDYIGILPVHDGYDKSFRPSFIPGDIIYMPKFPNFSPPDNITDSQSSKIYRDILKIFYYNYTKYKVQSGMNNDNEISMNNLLNKSKRDKLKIIENKQAEISRILTDQNKKTNTSQILFDKVAKNNSKDLKNLFITSDGTFNTVPVFTVSELLKLLKPGDYNFYMCRVFGSGIKRDVKLNKTRRTLFRQSSSNSTKTKKQKQKIIHETTPYFKNIGGNNGKIAILARFIEHIIIKYIYNEKTCNEYLSIQNTFCTDPNTGISFVDFVEYFITCFTLHSGMCRQNTSDPKLSDNKIKLLIPQEDKSKPQRTYLFLCPNKNNHIIDNRPKKVMSYRISKSTIISPDNLFYSKYIIRKKSTILSNDEITYKNDLHTVSVLELETINNFGLMLYSFVKLLNTAEFQQSSYNITKDFFNNGMNNNLTIQDSPAKKISLNEIFTTVYVIKSKFYHLNSTPIVETDI